MKLNEYFTKFESIDFDGLLAKFKSTFSSNDLNDEHQNVQVRLNSAGGGNQQYVKINVELNAIIKQNSQHFHEFLLDHNRLEKYSNCRALKKVKDSQRLIEKTYEKEQRDDMKKLLDGVNTNVDNNWNKYYAVCNNFTDSDLQHLPDNVIKMLGHYIDGDISI